MNCDLFEHFGDNSKNLGKMTNLNLKTSELYLEYMVHSYYQVQLPTPSN